MSCLLLFLYVAELQRLCGDHLQTDTYGNDDDGSDDSIMVHIRDDVLIVT